MTSLLEQNWLTAPGKKPFELQVAFQLFDMKGQPEDEGSLTYRWSEVQGGSETIHSRLLGDVTSDPSQADRPPEQRRELILIGDLLPAFTRPGPALREMQGQPLLKTVRDGKVELRCFNPTEGKSDFDRSARVCFDPSGVLREAVSATSEMIRNEDATFAGSKLTRDVLEASYGRKTVSGHVTALTSFQPPPAPAQATPQDAPQRLHLSGSVVAGRKIGGDAPHYPDIAKTNRVSGSVVLWAVISKEGRITQLTPMVSPDESLTTAAVEAVRSWTYQPYLLNGVPTNVTTTITVNFNLFRSGV